MSRTEPSLDYPSPLTQLSLWLLLALLVASVVTFGVYVSAPPSAETSAGYETPRPLLAKLDRAWHLLGAARAERAGDLTADEGRLEEARALLDEALEEAPEHPKVYFYRGLERMASGDLEAARTSLGRAAEAARADDPVLLPILLTLSAAHTDLKDYAAAEKVLRQAAELAPESPSVWGNLGQVLWLRGKEEESKHAYQRKLQLEGLPVEPAGPI